MPNWGSIVSQSELAIVQYSKYGASCGAKSRANQVGRCQESLVSSADLRPLVENRRPQALAT